MEQEPKEPTKIELDESLGRAEREVEKFLFEEEEGQKPYFRRARERKERESLETTERQMTGATRPIPRSGVIPPERKIHMPMPAVEALKMTSSDKDRTTKLKENDFLRNVQHWIVNNPDYELKHLVHALEIRVEGETEMLPTNFLDFLIDNATKGDMDKDVRDLLWSVLRNIKIIKIYTTSGKITLGLSDSEWGLVRLYFNNTPPFDFYKAE